MSGDLDMLEARLNEMSIQLEMVPLDPFQYGICRQFIEHGRSFVASLKARHAPATLTPPPPPKHRPTRTAPEPLVLAPGKHTPVKTKGA